MTGFQHISTKKRDCMTSVNSEMPNIVPALRENRIAFVAFLMCIMGAAFYCYEYYLRVAPSVIQPELMATYSIGQAGLGTLIAYYYLAYVPLQIPVGLMMDYWGPRRVLTVACMLCSLGTYLFAISDLLWLAKIGRFMVGFGSAFAYVGVLKIANLWLPKRYFALVAGLCTTLGMLGAISGGVVMARFINISGWQQALLYAAIAGLALSFILWVIIRDGSDDELTDLGRASHQGNNIWVELLEVVKTKQLWINGVIGCLTFLPLTVFAEFWAVSYFEKLGLPKNTAALSSSIVFIGYAIGAPIWGKTSDIIKSRKIPLMIGSLIAAALAIYMFSVDVTNLSILFASLFLLGLFASVQILVFAIGEDSCRPGMSATTVSFTNFLITLGGMALQPSVGVLLDRFQIIGSNGEMVILAADFKNALLIMPIGLILASVLSLFLRETYNQ